MTFLEKTLDTLVEADLARLVADEIREGKFLDFKRVLPSDQTEEKKEFLADVCSFANTAGGHLVYGVAEVKGVAVEVSGVIDADLEAVSLRLENSIRDGIDPRPPLVKTRAIRLSNGRAVVLLEIGRSWAGPHMVTYKGGSRFYARNSSGKYQLDVQELRAAFVGSESVSRQIRDFRSERIAAVLSNELGFKFVSDALTVIHVLPLSAFSIGAALPLDQLRADECAKHLHPIYSSGSSDRVTFDGLLRYTESGNTPGKMRSSVLVFRTGCIEAIDCALLTPGGSPPVGGFPSGIYEQRIASALSNYLTYLKAAGTEAPYVVCLSVLNVRGYCFHLSNYYGDANTPVDREHLFFSEILVEDPTTAATTLLKPCFDALWNACGFAKSASYNRAGEWAPKNRDYVD